MRAVGRRNHCRPSAKLHVFHTPLVLLRIEFGITPDTTIRVHFGLQVAKTSFYPVMCRFLLYEPSQSTNVTDRRTDGRHAGSISAAYIWHVVLQCVRSMKNTYQQNWTFWVVFSCPLGNRSMQSRSIGGPSGTTLFSIFVARDFNSVNAFRPKTVGLKAMLRVSNIVFREACKTPPARQGMQQ